MEVEQILLARQEKELDALAERNWRDRCPPGQQNRRKISFLRG